MRTPARTGGVSRPLGQIIRANVLTPYNAVLSALTILVAFTRRWADMSVGAFVLLNSGIGITQEVRARHMLERLTILHAPTVWVDRDGATVALAVEEVVVGDVMLLRSGDQVPADGTALSDGLEVDESMLSGESEPVVKCRGDEVLSGGIVVAGAGRVGVTAIGADAYANRITEDIRRLRRTRSVLMADTNRLLLVLVAAMLVVTPLLMWGESRRGASWQDAVIDTSAALGAMVPDGLVLVTSLAFLLAAVRLARRGVLTHQLAAVEVLARADVVLLDKTGTLTDGKLRLVEVHRLCTDDVCTDDLADAALGALAAQPGTGAVGASLREARPAPVGWQPVASVEFSSARRWSAVHFPDHGAWALGAPETMLLSGADHDAADALASAGRRVLVLSHDDALPTTPSDMRPVALVVFEEDLREGVAEAVAYLLRQEVRVMVVSGDHPRTVAAVARRAGIPDVGQGLRFDELDQPVEPGALSGIGALGRVAPEQKRRIIAALQAAGHVVAMTGDGVNDALALKAADLGIAMAGGAPATRDVADIVLLDGDFTSLPRLVEEGRQVLGNIERVAQLFLVKVTYAGVLAAITGAFALPYPFLPRQLTWTAALTIGIPSLVLSGEPFVERFEAGYLRRVLRRSVPAGLLASAGLWACFEMARRLQGGVATGRAAVSVAAVVIGIGVMERAGISSRRQRILEAMMVALGALTLTMACTRRLLGLDLRWPVLLGALAAGAAVVLVQVAIDAGLRDLRPWRSSADGARTDRHS